MSDATTPHINERRIPFCKLGKFARFDPADIDAWVAERRVEPSAH